MTFHTKLTILIIILTLALLAPWFIWGDAMDAYFESAAYQQWLASIRPYAWAVGIALIVGDLVLPVPTAPIIATLGSIYGAFWGGLIGTVGSILAGLTAYGLARCVGQRAIRWLASDDELQRFQHFFDTWGVGGIIASRCMPVLPEVLTVLAGVARMHFGRFVIALIVGGAPAGFLLAWAGESAGQSSKLILMLTLLPAGLWCLYLLAVARRIPAKPATTAVTVEIDESRKKEPHN